jgi:hypothetical protein
MTYIHLLLLSFYKFTGSPTRLIVEYLISPKRNYLYNQFKVVHSALFYDIWSEFKLAEALLGVFNVVFYIFI